MKPVIAITILSAMSILMAFGQQIVVIDGDTLALRDTLDGKQVLLSYIERGIQNTDAIWITYNRRPGVDPWIRKTTNQRDRYSEENFIDFFRTKGIKILGALTTYDNCNCAGKCKAIGCPDMYLIHFKISPTDWSKLKTFYPEIETSLKSVTIR